MNSPGSSSAGLYIHVPFCTSICPYCDFAVTIAGEERRAAWAEGVVREAAMYSDCGMNFDTVYIGGGTPSSLDPRVLSDVVAGLRRHLTISDSAWVHLEANPEDTAPENLDAWRDLGVEFVSLGVQAFDDRGLRFLGRRHSATDAEAAVEALLEAGFHTVSIDLIYGLDGQTAENWRAQLDRAVGLGVQHLSCYQLTFHEGTVFGRRLLRNAIAETPEELQEELFFLTHELLTHSGHPAYEVSNFSRGRDHRSRHNQKYWDHTPYLGLGPSAHSFDGRTRWWNRRKLRLWQADVDAGKRPLEEREQPSHEQLVLETLMLGFRTAGGVDFEQVTSRFSVDLVRLNSALIDRLLDAGLVRAVGRRLEPTVEGFAVADTLARSFEIPTLPE
jgi:oxygen-independent coproporphyrinogen-3 oxidase